MGLQLWKLEEHKESLWPRNQIYVPDSRSELGHHAGYPLHGPQGCRRRGARGAHNEETTFQETSRFCDPIGLLSPVLIIGKLIFQDTWYRGVEWDELLPDDFGTRWRNWVTILPHLLEIQIPRWPGTKSKGNCQIHVFCGVSERAYGAVLYIRSTHGTETQVRILCSKNRLAPLKVTLPRLKLIAASVGAHLLNYFCRDTGCDVTEATLWSDSTWRWAGYVTILTGGTHLQETVSQKYTPIPHSVETLPRRGQSAWLLLTRG